jgi:hypothetical protein
VRESSIDAMRYGKSIVRAAVLDHYSKRSKKQTPLPRSRK